MEWGLDTMRPFNLVFQKSFYEEALDDSDVACLLATPRGKPLDDLFATARALREHVFGDQIFLYGFVYFSTYCQNYCNFCLYRQCNQAAPRYRKSIENILDVARALEYHGVHLIDLTMGEDPYYLQRDGERLLELVVRMREAVSLPLMVSPGVLKSEILIEMAQQGVDWYACYQETFNERLFARLRKGQDFNRRLEAKVHARQAGLLLEEGILLGVGESPSDIALALRYMQNLGTSQMRAMTFRPQHGTPMANWQVPDSLDELRIIATLRISFPDRLIPASLDVDGLEGLRARLNAGANVVTSVIPPGYGLAGVSRAWLGIQDRQRTVSSVDSVIKGMGLTIAPVSRYQSWFEKEKRRVGRQDRMDSKSRQPG
ncbi:MAG: methylornithine synthase PylB [Desulfobacteraceae bacterium]|nr:methylornithine synthase PylB [Desulfobacteraceae bacterium]